MHAMAKMAENRQRTGDLNWMPKVVPWRLAILAKLASAGDNGEKHPSHLETGKFENGENVSEKAKQK